MPRKIYRFGDFVFTSKDKARRFFGEMRKRWAIGTTISDSADKQAIYDLLQGHVDREEKIGGGVKRFFVDYAPDHFPSTCFWLERIDGISTDFGFFACIESIGKLNRQSLRMAIQPQIYSFRDARLARKSTFVSEFSGKSFSACDAHIDHKTPFEKIAAAFAEREGISIETELLTVSHDAKSTPTWKDDSIRARFVEFHKPFPLRLVSKSENLSDLRRASVSGRADERSAN